MSRGPTISERLAAAQSALDAVKAKAADRAADYAETVADVQASGATTLAAIAQELNARGIVTPRGGKWHPSSVRNLLQRLLLKG